MLLLQLSPMPADFERILLLTDLIELLRNNKNYVNKSYMPHYTTL